MVAGALRITNTEAGKGVEYDAGDFILEAIGHWHRALNIGNEPIRLVVIDQVEQGRGNTILRK
jgi:quercetin dioxygenase-like cupin family protein